MRLRHARQLQPRHPPQGRLAPRSPLLPPAHARRQTLQSLPFVPRRPLSPSPQRLLRPQFPLRPHPRHAASFRSHVRLLASLSLPRPPLDVLPLALSLLRARRPALHPPFRLRPSHLHHPVRLLWSSRPQFRCRLRKQSLLRLSLLPQHNRQPSRPRKPLLLQLLPPLKLLPRQPLRPRRQPRFVASSCRRPARAQPTPLRLRHPALCAVPSLSVPVPVAAEATKAVPAVLVALPASVPASVALRALVVRCIPPALSRAVLERVPAAQAVALASRHALALAHVPDLAHAPAARPACYRLQVKRQGERRGPTVRRNADVTVSATQRTKKSRSRVTTRHASAAVSRCQWAKCPSPRTSR